MDALFRERRGTLNVSWENHISFNGLSEEQVALLASPSGLAAAWILIHNAAVLGNRHPVVSIFNPGGANRCMIWDFFTPPQVPTFGQMEPPVYCDGKDPPAYCETDIPAWLGWLPEPGFRPGDVTRPSVSRPSNSPPPTSKA